MPVITLTTDFGDVYPAEMKGIILRKNPQIAIVDISNSIPRHDIIAGAFALLSAARYFPPDTIHIGVIDPEVGTSRRGIVIKSSSGQHFVGPDNGLLIPAAELLGSFRVYGIPESRRAAPTFHGRDIFAPLAARISLGYKVEKLPEVKAYTRINFGKAKATARKIEGKVIYIDRFGNTITNIPKKMVKSLEGSKLKFKNQLIHLARTYADAEEGSPLLIIGSHGFLEIAANRASASRIFKLKTGNKISFAL